MANALVHNGKRYKVWESRRFMILLSLVVIVLLALAGMHSIRTSSVTYGEVAPMATPSAVCPGETFTYQVRVEVENPDTVILLTEDWCKANTEICPNAFAAPDVRHNIRHPLALNVPAKRVVPVNLPPGAWEFRHCNTSTSNAGVSVACYYVDVTIKPPAECQDTGATRTP